MQYINFACYNVFYNRLRLGKMYLEATNVYKLSLTVVKDTCDICHFLVNKIT